MCRTKCTLCLTALLLAACTGDPYQGIYEGIKGNNDVKRTPNERAMTPAPSYEEYKKEREQKKQLFRSAESAFH